MKQNLKYLSAKNNKAKNTANKTKNGRTRKVTGHELTGDVSRSTMDKSIVYSDVDGEGI